MAIHPENAKLTDPVKIDQMLNLAEHVKKGIYSPQETSVVLDAHYICRNIGALFSQQISASQAFLYIDVGNGPPGVL